LDFQIFYYDNSSLAFINFFLTLDVVTSV